MNEQQTNEGASPEEAKGEQELFRHYEFTIGEVHKEVERFIQEAGYQLEPPSYIGFVRPSFRARRQTEKTTYEIIGVVGGSIEEAIDGFSKLMAIKAVLGNRPDYVLVLPPINEYLLLEFFRGERGHWYFEVKDHNLMMWLTNPEDETTWSTFGSPRDKYFNEFLVMAKMGIDQILGMQLGRQRLLEEEFGEIDDQ